jgi:predicted ATP-grasp superfamily ATP-dependent carboligase
VRGSERIIVRFFVYEYLSTGLASGLSPSLLEEGWAMLRAVAQDFVGIPSAEVRTLLNPTLPTASGCRVEAVDFRTEERSFRRLARWADHTLVIAPEFDDLLSTRCRWVEEEGGRLLGPSSQAVVRCADKLALSHDLRAAGVRMPECCSASPRDLRFPLVCKPRFGAGSQATFLVHRPEELAKAQETARLEGWTGEMICQRHVQGFDASVAFLVGPKQIVALAPAAQHLSEDGRFHYRGGTVPLSPGLAERAIRVARPAIDAVAGLRGYVGVDVVLGETDWVIEINPRVTTSYLGLRALTATNLAELMVPIVRGEETGPPTRRPGVINFSPLAVSRSPNP